MVDRALSGRLRPSEETRTRDQGKTREGRQKEDGHGGTIGAGVRHGVALFRRGRRVGPGGGMAAGRLGRLGPARTGGARQPGAHHPGGVPSAAPASRNRRGAATSATRRWPSGAGKRWRRSGTDPVRAVVAASERAIALVERTPANATSAARRGPWPSVLISRRASPSSRSTASTSLTALGLDLAAPPLALVESLRFVTGRLVKKGDGTGGPAGPGRPGAPAARAFCLLSFPHRPLLSWLTKAVPRHETGAGLFPAPLGPRE